MKLTSKLLKELILNELKEAELNPTTPAAPGESIPKTDKERAAQATSPEDKASVNDTAAKSTSELGKKMVELGRAIQQSKIKGIDPAEVALIESVTTAILEMAAKQSAGSFLKKLEAIIVAKQK